MRRSSSNGNSAKRRSDPAPNISPETTLQAENGGTLIVITAPLTEAIDHAGYFIQMAMASLPIASPLPFPNLKPAPAGSRTQRNWVFPRP